MRHKQKYKIGSLIKSHYFIKIDGQTPEFGIILRYFENQYEVFIPNLRLKKWIDENVLDVCFQVFEQ